MQETNAGVSMNNDTETATGMGNHEDDAASEHFKKGCAIETSPSQHNVASENHKIEFSVDLILKMKAKIDSNKYVYRGSFSSKPLGPLAEEEVAVKVLGVGFDHDMVRKDGNKLQKAKMWKKMLTEIEHLRVLIHHPNVVRYIHSVADNQRRSEPRICYLIMELCDAVTLRGRLEKLDEYKELRDNAYRKAVILHITQGLRYIHSKGICHRDMKPSNILFSSDKRVVKISDFGLSKPIVRESGEHSSTTSTGTNNYRAPETFPESCVGKPKDRSDIFSIGIVYFNLLSGGRHPFGEDCDAQTANIKDKNCEPSFTGLNGPDAALAKDIMQKMLRYDPAKRPDASLILQHPYFWSVDKIVGFYVRVVDYLKIPSSSSSKKAFYDNSSSDDKPSDENQGNKCSVDLDYTVCNDITTVTSKGELSKAKDNLCRELRKGGNTKEIVEKLHDLLFTCRKSLKVWQGESHLAESLPPRGASESDRNELLLKFNEIDKLQRPSIDHCNDNIVKMEGHLCDLKSRLGDRTGEAVISNTERNDIRDLAIRVVENVADGHFMSWLECLEHECNNHEKNCKDCQHSEFLSNFLKANERLKPDLFKFVNYIRNKLVHLEDDKMKKELNWMRHHRDILNFVTSIVPELLPRMFWVLKDELSDYIEENKQQDSSFFLPDIH